MALLTIIGISATNTTSIELQIAGNDRIYKQNFYRAEAATMEAAQVIENATNTQLTDRTITALIIDVVMTDLTNWTSGNFAVASIDPNITTNYSMVDRGIAPGSSLDSSGAQLHEYSIYGLCNANNGQSFIVIGYRKRF